ncbi:amidohydrolase family protein, partial [candidate division KSB1 bacterium]|nr:amidohydrolase family protein [candidate division KSB1 bacterium]NIR70688.1 amidohydrolase family protein [candidate division KSB1 bacterium]NIS27752.1 amidohydrolase family protein [candidate division KSB1 bacterium]NIT74599.1 amidohydrolase family protein [candidate division KSB1 bacterium]NIU28419.1 amidohydrolase family protein [candidate division KSB1 bacterium]
MNPTNRNSKRAVAVVLFCLCLPLATFSQTETPKVTAVKCGQLIDGRSDDAIKNTVILIEHGRITEVGLEVTIPENAKIVDLGEHTVLPGLIDTHTH